MLCAVYKSKKKADTYLYILKKDDFSDVPQGLLETFGVPQFIAQIPTDKKKTIAGKPTEEFQRQLKEQKFYLQLPPKSEDLLAQHRSSLGLSEVPDVKFN